MLCPRCAAAVPDGAPFCPRCGGALDGPTLAEEPTATLDETRLATRVSGPPASAPAGGQRFVPGALIENRYRVIGLLGQGGMGEVYRADDLRLGHPVALKFLPEALDRDPAARERFLGEVRTARRVSHPNVCRVHDLGEAGGQHFLTMEYIDGEDLASLLRRIGRLPGDKALEIARQIGSGLAAAHDSGVLHRDLKPANVMIDGRGRARITDFGLAGLAGSFADDQIAGTPAYMAPEQLRGGPLDERSDLYAYGLVAYELFTGKRPFGAGATLGDLLRARDAAAPLPPGQLVKDLDPRVEKAILRCLEKDPAARPRSAAEVLALLPGGDPLAAAMAAGETPSPELVAAGGEEGSLAPWLALGGFLALVATLGLLAALAPGATIAGAAQPRKPAAALADRARSLLGAGGSAMVDDGHHFAYDWEIWDQKNERERAQELTPATPLFFWYRASPEPMRPRSYLWLDDPPMDLAGMASVRLDVEGRLLALTRVPPTLLPLAQPATAPATLPAGAPPPSGADWQPLLAASGLDPATLEPAEPRWLPPYFADERRAWSGRLPGSEVPLRVEAAAIGGQPFYFEVAPPWRQPQRQPPPPPRATAAAASLLLFLVLGGAITLGLLLARRNLQRGRADLPGAIRLAKVVALFSFAGWLALAHLPPAFGGLAGQLLEGGIYRSALAAGLLFTLYLALEPFLRRHTPRRIVAWTRLFEGRFRDPLVGRDLLAGTCFGAATALSIFFTVRHEASLETTPDYLEGAANVLPMWLESLPQQIFLSLVSLLILQLVTRLVRSERVAAIALFGLMYTLHVLFIGADLTSLVVYAVICGLLMLSLLRFGLLTLTIHYLVFMACLHGPLTADRQAIHFGAGLASAALILLLGGFGAWVSLGKRPLLAGLYDD